MKNTLVIDDQLEQINELDSASKGEHDSNQNDFFINGYDSIASPSIKSMGKHKNKH